VVKGYKVILNNTIRLFLWVKATLKWVAFLVFRDSASNKQGEAEKLVGAFNIRNWTRDTDELNRLLKSIKRDGSESYPLNL